MSVKTYDPSKIVMTLGTILVSGYADGEFVKAARDADTFTKFVGTDGEVSRTRNRNKTGTVTFTLAQTSLTNDALAALAETDELTGAGVVPVLIKDLNGTTLFAAGSAWIRKPPEVAYGKEIGHREWVIDTGPVEVFVGGSLASAGI